jgi:hypothetical protein
MTAGVHREGKHLMANPRDSCEEKHWCAVLLIASSLILTAIGCETENQPLSSGTSDRMAPPTKPTFTVHDVFYIAPPVDSVIATGVVDVGTFHVGDSVVVADQIRMQIGKIESIERGEISEAVRGDNVGFHLIGVDRGQIKSGDQIFGNN